MTRGLVKLALTLALLLALFHLLDISLAGILDRLRNFGFVVVAALLPLTLIPWVSASRWSYLLALSGIKERMTVLWGFNWKATFLGLFLPGSQGMDFFRILFMLTSLGLIAGIATMMWRNRGIRTFPGRAFA